MLVIGLTGSIAAGKSTVSRVLEQEGVLILDADSIAREVVEPGTEGLKVVCEAFGGVLLPDGTMDRKKVGQLIFSDKAARLQLNGILHPLITGEIERRLEAFRKESPDGVAAIDAALLIEAGMTRLCDEIWVVYAEDGLRLARLMVRDGMSEAAARARMESQMPQEEKLRFASRSIDNSRSPAETACQVRWCLKEIKERMERN